MELRDIQTFLALAEELHFGRAAERLRVSQGRVSQTISALEKEIGGSLFERTSRPTRLTPLGEQFLADVRPGYADVLNALRRCQAAAATSHGLINIGYAPLVDARLVMGYVTAFESGYPGHRAAMRASQPLGNMDFSRLTRGEEDLVLVWVPGGGDVLIERLGLSVGPVLASERRAVLVPADHEFARREAVSVEDLAGRPMIRPWCGWPEELRSAWSPTETPSGRTIGHACDHPVAPGDREPLVLEDMQTLVARGYGLHFSQESVLERAPFPGLKAVPIIDLPPAVLLPVWMAGSAPAGLAAFLEVVASPFHEASVA